MRGLPSMTVAPMSASATWTKGYLTPVHYEDRS